MRRELAYLPQVAEDYLEAFNYYESFSPTRGGARFELAFNRAAEHIEQGLVLHYEPFPNFRRVHVPGYPYNIYYRLVDHRAVVVALLYTRFDPMRIEKALRTRSGG
jgi:plasmid stabilization system protein ParE